MALKVNWFIPVNQSNYNHMSASVWIRCLQLIPYLEERGLCSTINEPEAAADVAIFVRCQDEQAYQLAQQQKQRGQHIVFDLCVNYFAETGLFKGGYGTTKERVTEALCMVEVADVVTCSSAYIAQRAREFHSWVEYLPDSIDHRHFSCTKPIKDFYRSKLCAIWSGVASKAHELEPVLPLLQRRGIELVVISNKPPRLMLPGWLWKHCFRHHFIPWQYETFPRKILGGEICIVYRPVNDSYNQGHSFFKIGVFMAQGVPAIASPVSSYQELLENGSGGHICYSIKEWEEALDRILQERETLVHWSQQARKVMEPYWTERVADRYATLFEQLCLQQLR